MQCDTPVLTGPPVGSNLNRIHGERSDSALAVGRAGASAHNLVQCCIVALTGEYHDVVVACMRLSVLVPRRTRHHGPVAPIPLTRMEPSIRRETRPRWYEETQEREQEIRKCQTIRSIMLRMV